MEFFDHTYQDHFGCEMPMFLPRECVLGYILTRCTKNNTNFFDGVKFNTGVESVKYDTELEKFIIHLSDKTESSFDMCIWAAGVNGKPKIPPSIDNVLTSGGFKGVTMHSSQTDSNFDEYVRGKKVMIVGDQYSAEDLALQAIKLGVEIIEIVTRRGEGIACDTGAWPMDKVDINEGYIPTGVTDDGHGIVLSRVKYDWMKDKHVVNSRRQITLEDVDTVIYCTGYVPNFDMLDGNLSPNLNQSSYYLEDEFPKDWKMSNNYLSKDLGDVPIGDTVSELYVSLIQQGMSNNLQKSQLFLTSIIICFSSHTRECIAGV